MLHVIFLLLCFPVIESVAGKSWNFHFGLQQHNIQQHLTGKTTALCFYVAQCFFFYFSFFKRKTLPRDIEAELCLNCPRRGDLLRVSSSVCVCVCAARWWMHRAAARMIVWHVLAGIKVPLIVYEVQHWHTNLHSSLEADGSLWTHRSRMMKTDDVLLSLSLLTSPLASKTCSLKTNRWLQQQFTTQMSHVLGFFSPFMVPIFFFLLADSSHEQNRPFPGENPPIQQTLTKLPFVLQR